MGGAFLRDAVAWLLRRLLELVTFFACTFWSLGLGGIENTYFILTAYALFFYCILFLYWPLSAALWVCVLRGWDRKSRSVGDAAFFILHSFVAVSFMKNGIFAFSRPIDFENPLEFGWFGVFGLHVVLLLAAHRRDIL